jgi:hypothetical protein
VVQQQLEGLAQELVLILGAFLQEAEGLVLDSLYVAYPETRMRVTDHKEREEKQHNSK